METISDALVIITFVAMLATLFISDKDIAWPYVTTAELCFLTAVTTALLPSTGEPLQNFIVVIFFLTGTIQLFVLWMITTNTNTGPKKET